MNVSGNEILIRKRPFEELLPTQAVTSTVPKPRLENAKKAPENPTPVQTPPTLTKAEAKQVLERFEPLAPVLQKALEGTQILRREFQAIEQLTKPTAQNVERPIPPRPRPTVVPAETNPLLTTGKPNLEPQAPINVGVPNKEALPARVELPVQGPLPPPREGAVVKKAPITLPPPENAVRTPVVPTETAPLKVPAPPPHENFTALPQNIPAKPVIQEVAHPMASSQIPLTAPPAQNEPAPAAQIHETALAKNIPSPTATPTLHFPIPAATTLENIRTRDEIPIRSVIHAVVQPPVTPKVQAVVPPPRNETARVTPIRTGVTRVNPQAETKVEPARQRRERGAAILIPIPVKPQPAVKGTATVVSAPTSRTITEKIVPPPQVLAARPSIAVTAPSETSTTVTSQSKIQTARPIILPSSGPDIPSHVVRERNLLAFQRRIREREPQVFLAEARQAAHFQQAQPTNAPVPLEQVVHEPKNIGLHERPVRTETVARIPLRGDNGARVPVVNERERPIHPIENFNGPRLTPPPGIATAPPLLNMNQLRRSLPTNVRARLVQVPTVNLLDLVL